MKENRKRWALLLTCGLLCALLLSGCSGMMQSLADGTDAVLGGLAEGTDRVAGALAEDVYKRQEYGLLLGDLGKIRCRR